MPFAKRGKGTSRKTSQIDPKWVSLGGSGGTLGRSWGVLSRLGGGFGGPRGILDASWVHLGSVRTRFEAIFGRSWRDLGGIWGTFWDVLRGLETSWGGLGAPWRRVWTSRVHLGGVRRRFEAIFGGVFWEVFWDEPINLELKRSRGRQKSRFLYFSSDGVTQEVHRHSGSTRTPP